MELTHLPEATIQLLLQKLTLQENGRLATCNRFFKKQVYSTLFEEDLINNPRKKIHFHVPLYDDWDKIYPSWSYVVCKAAKNNLRYFYQTFESLLKYNPQIKIFYTVSYSFEELVRMTGFQWHAKGIYSSETSIPSENIISYRLNNPIDPLALNVFYEEFLTESQTSNNCVLI